MNELIADRYRLESSIGAGGQGTVYSAMDVKLERRVALKLLTASADPEQLARFRHEAELAKGLGHPNTVRVLDFGQDAAKHPFIVYEHLSGRSVDQLLAAGPIPEERVRAIATGVLKSLMEAHAAGIVHRDIKPANVFLCDYHGERDFVKVLDFGIAKAASQTKGQAAPLTNVGFTVGTPQYMAPEQVRGEAVSPATDLYALGISMAEMLSGAPLVIGSSVAEVAAQQLSEEPLRLPAAVLQSSLAAAIHRATRKPAAQRFQSAGEMLEALAPTTGARDAVSAAQPQPFGEAPTAVAPVTPQLATAPARLPKKGMSTGGLVLLLLAALVVVAPVIGAVVWMAGSPSASKKKSKAKDETTAREEGSTEPASDSNKGKPRERVSWVGSQLVITRVDGDSVDDIVGLCADGSADLVCAVSGATFEPLWKAHDTVGHAEVSGLFSRQQGIVLVTNHGVMRVYTPQTGATSAEKQLFMRPMEVCAPTEEPTKIWAEDPVARKQILVDPLTGDQVEAPPPASCSVGETRTDSCSDSPRAAHSWCHGVPLPGKVDGMAADKVKFTASEGVVLGHRSDGPAYDMIAGYEVLPNFGGRVRWSRPFNDGDPAAAVSKYSQDFVFNWDHPASIAGDRIFAISASSIAAFEVASGKTLWRKPRVAEDGVIAQGDRLYLLSPRRVVICATADGRELGRVGDP